MFIKTYLNFINKDVNAIFKIKLRGKAFRGKKFKVKKKEASQEAEES